MGCERAYFYHYYFSWGGWEREAPPLVGRVYTLKKRTNRYAWAGAIVHEAIRECLLKWLLGQPVHLAELTERTHNRMRSEFAASRGGLLKKPQSKPSFWGLVEHENNVEVSAQEWRDNWQTVETALKHFMDSAWPRRLQELDARQVLEADSKDFDSAYFLLDGIRVFAMPDVAFISSDGPVHIVDWKTGSPSDTNVEQVVGYALFVEARHALPALGARVSLVYLNQKTEESFSIDEAALHKFRAFFKASVEAMQAKLVHVESNTPQEASHFLKTTLPSKCVLCPFLKVCEAENGEGGVGV